MTFDEAVLDDDLVLGQRDRGHLLWSLATAGAQVRRAAESLADFGVERLRTDTAPRALLVATDLPCADALLTRCGSASTASVAWRGADLPRWAGPADALLVACVEGHSPRLAGLAAQSAQRGLEMAVVAPAQTPVAAAAGRAPWHELPRDLHPRAARWAVLTPLLQALDALAVTPVPPSLLVEIADALDGQAELAKPSGDAFTNAAKSLAIDFAESAPLVAGAGALAGVAAETTAVSLGILAGVVATAVSLPDGMAQAAAVLRGASSSDGSSDDDFFRDRVDDVPDRPRPRLLVVGDDGDPDDPLLGDQPVASRQLDEVAARRCAAALRDLAAQAGVRASSVDVPGGQPLARFAAATAFGDFTATYLALGLGVDPSRPAWDAR
ncbi:SIS domain-containing protein [Jatrophihabitans endophyticus]|uniref:SIS domain-containing protein n=1 Tax=Jatrophihabitans endophyticus TaxID=1206085 RepID=UPI001A0FF4C1|nr:SIS domain-containing protein [Jatrophihabitans endophyticus]MBE7187130.1 hypothetical protein [Jatrophihabitans endophyticus]